MNSDEMNTLDEIEATLRLADADFDYSPSWNNSCVAGKVEWLVNTVKLKDDLVKMFSKKLDDANRNLRIMDSQILNLEEQLENSIKNDC